MVATVTEIERDNKKKDTGFRLRGVFLKGGGEAISPG